MLLWGKGCKQGVFCALSLGLLTLAHGVLAGEKHDDPRTHLPMRKPGLWELTIHGHANAGSPPSQQVQQCTDGKAERIMLLAIVPTQENCSDVRAKRLTGQPVDGYDITLVCHVHEQRIETQVALRGDLQSVYSGTYTTRQPGALPRAPAAVNFQGRWLGNCKPDQRPGDMVLPNGITVNVVDDVRRAERHAH